MVPAIFKDRSLQEKFDKQGFVVAPFIEAEDIRLLNDLFDELHTDQPQGQGFVSGSYSNDLGYKKMASERITQIFSKQYERVFINYQAFGAAFLYKQPSKDSELGVHQDWTIVDEEQYVALNCWVPLTDINAKNGALHVLPGSQYPKYRTRRAPTIPFFFTGAEGEVISQALPQYVKAGEAVILNQSTIHYSPPNHSDKIRKAITAGVKTKDAPMIFHYRREDGKLERYAMPEDFLLRFENFATSIFERPALGEVIRTDEYENPVLDKEAIGAKIKKLKKDAGFETEEASFLGKLLAKLKAA